MAMAIARITATALRPGVSKNSRWYKPEHIKDAYTKAAERIAAGHKPMVMLTYHDAQDNSREIAAGLTRVTLEDDGSLDIGADIIGTEAGWDIAKLADSTSGRPVLRNVSIRGAWTGKVRRERHPDGRMVETADGLELDGVDFTKSPGVEGAEIKTFAWAHDGQENETEERVLITESVEATVTVTEETPGTGPDGVTDDVREAVRAVFAPAEVHVLEDGLCLTCGGVEEAKRSTKPYGDVPYADQGYLDADGKQAATSGEPGIKRYPLDKKHIRAAWGYINQAKNAAQYTAGQLKRIKNRIKAAMRSIGAKVSAESGVVGGFVIGEAVAAPEALLEWLGDDPKRSGSWSVSASNGPVNMSLSSYCMDPADLDVILRAAADAACKALAALDPDMDGDVDVPGVGSGSDDGSGHENAPDEDDPATENDPTETGGEGPAPGSNQEEVPAVGENNTSTSGAGAQSGLTLENVQKTAAEAAAAAVTAAFEARDEARAKAKKDRKDREAREAAEAAARKTALTEALAELGIKVPGQDGAAAESGGNSESGEGGPLTEADVEKRVGEALVEFKQQLITSGAILPQRAGMLVREHAVPDENNAPSSEDLGKMSDDDLMSHLGGAMAQHADSIRPVGAPA